MIINFRDLEVYKESFDLQFEVDDLLKIYPPDERFLLIDQSKRASRAIPALIAEGWAKRESIKEFQKFLRDAIAEANEMINHISVAERKGFIKRPGYGQELIAKYEKLAKKLNNLKNNWQNFSSRNQEVKKV